MDRRKPSEMKRHIVLRMNWSYNTRFNQQARHNMRAMGTKFYAVAKGKQVGVFSCWDQVQSLVVGCKGAVHKSFLTREAAEAWLNEHGVITETRAGVSKIAAVNVRTRGKHPASQGEHGPV